MILIQSNEAVLVVAYSSSSLMLSDRGFYLAKMPKIGSQSDDRNDVFESLYCDA